jgi:hypothetical protein
MRGGPKVPRATYAGARELEKPNPTLQSINIMADFILGAL